MHSSSFPVDSEMAHKQTNKVESVKNGYKGEKNIAKRINKSEQRGNNNAACRSVEQTNIHKCKKAQSQLPQVFNGVRGRWAQVGGARGSATATNR